MESSQHLLRLKTERIRLYREEHLRFYEPHDKQREFHKSQAKVRAFWGGNQVGKTTALVVETIWNTGKVHPYRQNKVGQVWSRVLVQDEGVLGSVMLEKFKQFTPRKSCLIGDKRWCGLRGGTWDTAWIPSDRILHFEDGSFIEFKTYKQERQSHGGAQRHFIAFDEEPPMDINEENLARQTTTGINTIYTMTPLNYSNWIYRALYQRSAVDPTVFLVTAATSENRFVSRETIEFLEKTYTDPTERAARLYGTPSYQEGLVYKEFGDHNILDPYEIPTRGVRYSVVIDPHEQKATAWNLFAESYAEQDGVTRLYCIAEGDVEGDIEHICNSIFAQLDSRPISLWLCDPSARRRAKIRGHDESIIEEFRQFIPEIEEANNSLDVGITRMRSAIKKYPNGARSKLCFSKTCPVTIHQIKNYSWKPPMKSGEDRTKPMVSLRENDHPDVVRYRIMHLPVNEYEPFESFGMSVYAN